MTEGELDDLIDDIAANPKKVTGDAGSVEEHPIPDLLALRKARQAEEAAAKPARGLRFTKLIPPGAV